MLIEKINSASFANGILRLEVAKTNGKGEWIETGTLEIPGSLVANVISQISTAATDISGQLVKTEISVAAVDICEITLATKLPGISSVPVSIHSPLPLVFATSKRRIPLAKDAELIFSINIFLSHSECYVLYGYILFYCNLINELIIKNSRFV
jgi:hypothetical protein